MFQFSCPLRWGDLDAQGHVNNAVVVDYLQEARVAFLLSGDFWLRPMRPSNWHKCEEDEEVEEGHLRFAD